MSKTCNERVPVNSLRYSPARNTALLAMRSHRILMSIGMLSLAACNITMIGAVVVTGGRFRDSIFSAPIPRTTNDDLKVIPFDLRIRSTIDSDVSSISNMISHELVVDTGKRPFNFKMKMERLKNKAAVETLLNSRIKTIQSAQQVLRKQQSSSMDHVSEADTLQALWSDDGFRWKLEHAAKTSRERHMWTNHNFACAPEHASFLQHKMVTAEDKWSGDIVGFCEIAMLSQPETAPTKGTKHHAFAPTVMNLVTSHRYRRRGIGSKLVNAAGRFAETNWASEYLNLYVDHDNDVAVNLYKRLGFDHTASTEATSTRNQLYMSKQLTTEKSREKARLLQASFFSI